MGYYTPSAVTEWLHEGVPAVTYKTKATYENGERKLLSYVDAIITYDSECTSTYIGGAKFAYVYAWMLGLNGLVMLGRTWDEFFDVMAHMIQYFSLQEDVLAPIYVHNLPYDFQFFRKFFTWEKVFALSNRKVIQARGNGFEFRDSLVLSGLPLSKMSVECNPPGSMLSLPAKYQMGKKIGDLDYDKVRTPSTPLSDEEIEYCIFDIKVLTAWLRKRLDDHNDTVATVPMTRTGYVRRDVRTKVQKSKQYKRLLRALQLTPEVYCKLKNAFQGGFTHANAMYEGMTLTNVQSHDITSSYPTVMVAEKFPMSPPVKLELCDDSKFRAYLDSHCCLFTIRMHNVRPRVSQENIISESRCLEIAGQCVNNGRVYTSDEVVMDITEVDFHNLEKFYYFDYEISDFYIFEKGYLPKEFVSCILDYYGKKTTMKGDDKFITEYNLAKECVNGLYGMTVMDIVKDIYTLSEQEWVCRKQDAATEIERNNNSRNRFIYYAWGVWITAYARQNLFRAILALGDDYIYADTDSVKYLNPGEHKQFFDDYNTEIIQKLEDAMDYHGLPRELVRPKNFKDSEKPLGVWDDDGRYLRFKTLGAKRYLTESLVEVEYEEYDEDGPTGNIRRSGYYMPKLKLTVAGLAKGAVKFLDNMPDPFNAFEDELVVPAEYAGKLTHYYDDRDMEADVTDYLGNTERVKAWGFVHLEPQEYNLSLGEMYRAFLGEMFGVHEEEFHV